MQHYTVVCRGRQVDRSTARIYSMQHLSEHMQCDIVLRTAQTAAYDVTPNLHRAYRTIRTLSHICSCKMLASSTWAKETWKETSEPRQSRSDFQPSHHKLPPATPSRNWSQPRSLPLAFIRSSELGSPLARRASDRRDASAHRSDFIAPSFHRQPPISIHTPTRLLGQPCKTCPRLSLNVSQFPSSHKH